MTAVDLDLARVEAVSWRAICRHQLSEREMVIAATVIRRSFVVGRPFVQLDAQAELAVLTGISRGNVHQLVERLVRGRALEVSRDGRIYTFLPPSRQWPWLYAPRHKDAVALEAAERLERAIDAANGVEQGELFASEVERELGEALQIERMRAALLDHHRVATGEGRSRAGEEFPVSVCAPKPAPRWGGGEPAQPPVTDDTAGPGGASDISATRDVPEASEYYYWPSREDVPESGTSSQIGNAPLNALNASMCSGEPQTLKAVSALSVAFPIRERGRPGEPLDPGADENAVIDHLRSMLGEAAMKQWGGFWRNAVRRCRRGVLESIGQLRLRIETRGEPKSRGGWLRDQYLRFERAFAANDRLRAEFAVAGSKERSAGVFPPEQRGGYEGE